MMLSLGIEYSMRDLTCICDVRRNSTGWPKKVSHYQMIKKSY